MIGESLACECFRGAPKSPDTSPAVALVSTHRRIWRRSRRAAPTGARFDSPGRSALGRVESSTGKPQRGEIPVGKTRCHSSLLHFEPRHETEFYGRPVWDRGISPHSGLKCSMAQQKTMDRKRGCVDASARRGEGGEVNRRGRRGASREAFAPASAPLPWHGTAGNDEAAGLPARFRPESGSIGNFRWNRNVYNSTRPARLNCDGDDTFPFARRARIVNES
jgi:hypothetical protein